MGMYQKKLQGLLKASVTHKKTHDAHQARFEKMVDAANAFTSAYSKAASKMTSGMSSMTDSIEECGKLAAELSVYEDELAKAQKSKDKKAIAAAQKKMKPLIAKYQAGAKVGDKTVADWNKARQELDRLASAIGKASA